MKKILLTIFIIFIFSGCIATKSIKPLRYDGIYKQYRGSSVVYLKFEKDTKEWNSIKYSTENDKKAIQELNLLAKKGTYKREKRYINKEKEVHTYGSNKSASWHGGIKKNKNGELKDSFFIKVKNNKIKETIDLRILDKFKVYSFDNKPLSNDIFEAVKVLNNKYIIVKKNDKYGILDVKTKHLKIPAICQWIDTTQFENMLIPFKKNNKYGFFDSNFNIIIEAQYDSIKSIQYKGYFIDGIQAVKLNNKWLIIDKHNNRVIDDTFDDIGPYASKKFVPIYDKQKKLYQFINLNTKKYTGIYTYKNTTIYNYNILDVGKGQELIFNSNGKQILKYPFYNIFPYKNKNDKTYFIVSLDNSFNSQKGILDKDSNFIFPDKYKNITPIYSRNGNIKYFNSKLDYYHHSLYSSKGDLILAARYEKISIFNEDRNYILAKRNKSYSFGGPYEYYIFKEGSEKPLFTADYIGEVNNNSKYTIFRKNGLYGIIDMNLNIIVKAKYTNISDINDNYYATYLDDENIVYKIGEDNQLLKVKGRIDFKDKYITVANRQKDSIYNYKFKKLNSKDLVSIEVCKNKNVIIFKDKDEKWAVIYKEKVKYLEGDFENVRCGNERFIIAKLKNKYK